MRLFAYLLSGERSEKTLQPLKSFFVGCLVALATLLWSLAEEKNFSACDKVFFLTHSDILLWPHSIWLWVRVAQCAMALRVMVQSHLGWPWECHKLTWYFLWHHSWWVCSSRWMAPFLLPSALSHPPAHDQSPPACAHECITGTSPTRSP